MIKRILKMLSKALPLFYTLLIVLPLGCSLFITDERFTKTNKVWGCGHFLGLVKLPIQCLVCTPLGSYFQAIF